MPPCSNMSIPRSTFVPEFPAKKPLKIEILQPLAAPKAQRHVGVVKSFNSNSGFGFIECKLSNDKYSRDVFLHKAQAGEIEVGTVVEFAIDINERGMPQARDVKRADETVSDTSGSESCSQVGQISPTSPPVTPQVLLQQPQFQLQQPQQQILVAANHQIALAPQVAPQVVYQPVVFANGGTTVMNLVPVLINPTPQMAPMQLAA
eukprot:TRINITY_DN4690_c0_g1_i4.p1 TRINITY_DN4690_c0_g1~~TRINITY_DN4690_c0_g1_i4.p1  ORF type:complete len:205 (+),score=46.21 TRINITY_DN4690_c0_g1_i4:55-669(+)